MRRRSRAAQDRLADASAYAAEAVGAVRTMQAFGRTATTAARFAAASEDAYAAARDSIRARALLTGVAIFLISASVVGVMWYGAQGVLPHTMTGGELSQFVLYAVFGAGALGQLSEVYGDLAMSAGAAERLTEILATEPAIRAPSPADAAAGAGARRGELRGRALRLPDPSGPRRPRRPDLRGGAGRAHRHRRPVGGRQVHGLPAAPALLRSAGRPDPGGRRRHRAGRSRTPCAPASPWFRRTRWCSPARVTENIRYGRPEAGEAEVRRAAELANAHGFIAALPQGYATQVGERGVTLSGGQRQRIAIARAILKDAPILLLDEATSALDAESERAVQAALDTLMQGRTTLVIAHRLATIRAADRILVLDDGRIVETGTHESLLAQGALYAQLANLQFTDALDETARGKEPRLRSERLPAGGVEPGHGRADACRACAMAMLDLARFPRLPLLTLPTPIEPLDGLARHLGEALNGVRIFVKRDDVAGIGLGGNKLRKLEYLLGAARAEGADTVVTVGAIQSNHARLTAAAAAQAGLACELFLTRSVPRQDPDYTGNGNRLLDDLFGATVHELPGGRGFPGGGRGPGGRAPGAAAAGSTCSRRADRAPPAASATRTRGRDPDAGGGPGLRTSRRSSPPTAAPAPMRASSAGLAAMGLDPRRAKSFAVLAEEGAPGRRCWRRRTPRSR